LQEEVSAAHHGPKPLLPNQVHAYTYRMLDRSIKLPICIEIF
jgi:hypothetical protein